MTAPHLAILLPGPWEWVIVAFIALLFFGNRIPGMARSLGQGIVEFRKGLKGEKEEEKQLPEGEGKEKREESA